MHNVADASSTRALFDDVVASQGKFDILVNNAGVASQASFDKVTEQEWDRLNCQASVSYTKGRGGSEIANISPFSGRNAVEEYVMYNTTRTGIVMPTQTLALELAPHQVNMNMECPGIVKTPIWEPLNPEQWSRQKQMISLGRGQSPEGIGEAVAFLVSDRARSITGATIPVTGGLAMW